MKCAVSNRRHAAGAAVPALSRHALSNRWIPRTEASLLGTPQANAEPEPRKPKNCVANRNRDSF
jgi:hypothetical protein